MSGSLQITPGTSTWTAKSAINTLVPGKTLLTVTGWVKVNSYARTANSNIFNAQPISGIQIAFSASPPNGFIQFFLSGTSLLSYSWPVVPGQPLFFAMTLNAAGTSRIWLNGAVVASKTNVGPMPPTATATQFGWSSAGGVDFLMSEPAFYPTELNGPNLLELRNRTKEPGDLGAISYWTLQGTPGANPDIADAGLHDQIGSNHLTTITGLPTAAVYSATDIIYNPPVTVIPYVSRHEMLFFGLGTNPLLGPAVPAYVTAVNANPLVWKNGVPVKLQGPFRSSLTTGGGAQHPFVSYHPVGGVLPTDVVTWSAPDGWLTSAQGGARNEAGTLANYVGSYEPGMFGYVDFDPPAGWETMAVGWNCPSTVNQTHCILKNVAHRCGAPWFNVDTEDPVTRYPLTIKAANQGTVGREVWNSSGYGNGLDNRSWPIPTGTWVIMGDETAPASPMNVFLSVQVAGTIDNSANQLTTPTITPGTIVGGVELNKKFSFSVNYLNGPLPTFNPSINIQIQTPGHGAGPNTFTNLRVFEPGNAPMASPEQVCNDNFANAVTAPGNIHTPILRFMEATAGYGIASLVYPEDFPPLHGWLGYDVPAVRTWQDWTVNEPTYRQNRKVPIYQYRKYDLAVSPNVYCTFPGRRTVPSDNSQCGQFMWKPADWGLGYDWQYHGAGYSAHLMPIEVVCALNDGTPINHNMQTGQIMTIPAAVGAGVNTTDDQGHTGKANTFVSVGIFVTGPHTFMFHCSSGLPTTNKMGYVTGGPYLQQTSGVNLQTESNIWSGGHALMEDIGCLPATLTGTGLWVATTHCLSDSGVAELATRLRDSSPRGTKFYVQYGNEILIPNFQNSWLQAVASIEGFRATDPVNGALQITRAAVHRMAQVHAIFKTVFGAVGDAGSIVCVYQPFVVSPTGTLDGMVYMQEASIPCDAIATALYIDMDYSPSYKMAAAMVAVNEQITIGGVPTFASIAHPSNGGPGQSGILTTWVDNAPLPMGGYHDITRHHLKYAKNNQGLVGGLGICYSSIINSGYGGGEGSGWVYPFPKIIGYECSPSTMIPGGVSTKTKRLRAMLTHDYNYDPAMYDTIQAFCQFSQQPGPAGTVGAALICMEAIHGQRQSGGNNFVCPDGNDNAFVECWQRVIYQGQPVGRGLGNRYALTSLGGDGLTHDFENEAVAAQSEHDWIAAAAGAPPSTSFTVSPTTVPENSSTPITLTLRGTATAWTSGSVVLITNSLSGTTTVIPVAWNVTSTTLATFTITTGSGVGQWKLTVDGIDSAPMTVGHVTPPNGGNGGGNGGGSAYILQESGFHFLLEDGSGALLLESSTIIVSAFASFVNPLSVQADQDLSNAVTNISPTSVQLDSAASNALFGNIDPRAVQ